MVGGRGVNGRGPDPPILLLDEVRVAQAFCTTVTPFASNPLVKTFRESFVQPICDGFRHDRVVVVVFSLESVAQFLQADPAGYRERTDMIKQPRLSGRDEVRERSARLIAFLIRLLAEEVKSFEHLSASEVRVQLDIVAHRTGGKKAAHAPPRAQIF